MIFQFSNVELYTCVTHRRFMDNQRTRDALVSFVTHFTKKVLEENDELKKSASSRAMYLISEPGTRHGKDMIPLGLF